MQVWKTQVRTWNVGKHTYGKHKYEIKATIVSRLIVKSDGRRYCTTTHKTVRIGCDECFNTLFNDKKSSRYYKATLTRGASRHISQDAEAEAVTLSQQWLTEHKKIHKSAATAWMFRNSTADPFIIHLVCGLICPLLCNLWTSAMLDRVIFCKYSKMHKKLDKKL